MLRDLKIISFALKILFKTKLKPFLIVSIIVASIIFTSYTQALQMKYSLELSKDKKASFEIGYRYLLVTTLCGISQQAKFFFFQILFSDIVDDFFEKVIKYILERNWEIKSSETKIKKTNVKFSFKECIKNGAYQVFMLRGMHGMAKLHKIILLNFLPRILSLIFISKIVMGELDKASYFACILIFISIIIASFIDMLLEIYFRTKFIVAEAEMNRYISECIEQNEIITYMNMEKIEQKHIMERTRKYKKYLIYLQISKVTLTLTIYIVSNFISLCVFYLAEKKYTIYPKDMLFAFQKFASTMELQTVWMCSFLTKLRKSVVDTSYAFEFTKNIDSIKKKNCSRKYENIIEINSKEIESNDMDSEKENLINRTENFEKENKNLSSETSELASSKEFEINNCKNKNIKFTDSETDQFIVSNNLDMPFNSYVYDSHFIEFKKFYTTGKFGNQMFQELNLKILFGQKILIKGENGIGKTSILKSLFRQHTYNGQILINKQDCHDIEKDYLSEIMSICPQKTFLFNRSIRENLNYGNTAADHEIINVFSKVNFLNKFNELENNLDYKIQPNAINLSQGESKKIVIARTLLKKAQIYWFDEPFTGLDLKSEKNIINTILKMKATIFCVLHNDVYDSLFDIVIDLRKINH